MGRVLKNNGLNLTIKGKNYTFISPLYKIKHQDATTKKRKLVAIVHQSRPEQLAELYPASEIRGIVLGSAEEQDGATGQLKRMKMNTQGVTSILPPSQSTAGHVRTASVEVPVK